MLSTNLASGKLSDGQSSHNPIPFDGAVKIAGPGKIGGAVKFDLTPYIDTGQLIPLKTVPDLTVHAWFKRDVLGQLCTIIGGRLGWAVSFKASNVATIVYYTDWEADTVGDLGVLVKKWHCLTVVRDDRAGKVYFYLDGLLKETITQASGSAPPTGTNHWFIGADNNSGAVQFFNGAIADVRVYRRALSDGEVRALYIESINGYPNLLSHLPITYFIPSAAQPSGTFFPYF